MIVNGEIAAEGGKQTAARAGRLLGEERQLNVAVEEMLPTSTASAWATSVPTSSPPTTSRIIDSGLPKHPTIFKAVAEAGVSPLRRSSTSLITHHHVDHTGSLAALVAGTGRDGLRPPARRPDRPRREAARPGPNST